MRPYYCDCGQEVFFGNELCVRCGATVGFEPSTAALITLEEQGSVWRIKSNGKFVNLCSNGIEHGVCNAIVEGDSPDGRCHLCQLNRTVPNLSKPENIDRWNRLEQAKRRLYCGLHSLGLPLTAAISESARGLYFDFLEDQRTNPDVAEKFITTGYSNGLVTINILEADDLERDAQRELSRERYRTILGHMRHEVGHYFYELLVNDHEGFVQVFGDPELPYDETLENYYEQGPQPGWETGYISAYASAHPLEDWAESFAHYLHMMETLETAISRNLIQPFVLTRQIDETLRVWDSFAASLNELNHGLGLADAYPFVVTPYIADKLRYINACVLAYRQLQVPV